jgi:hypothetical protein
MTDEFKTDSHGGQWTAILGEMEVEDPNTGKRYLLIVGYAITMPSLYMRVWDINTDQFCGGEMVDRYKMINVPYPMLYLLKDYAWRMEKMKAFT